MECYVYGETKRKRKQGDSLCVALESHVREHLNMRSLKAQDKKLMAWTLGELAFFAYTSAIDQQGSAGMPAIQALRNTDFLEAASFIASERGVLSQTPEAVLRRVSANMETRFREYCLAEALESFIKIHGPAQRNVCPRTMKQAPAPPWQRRDPAPAAAGPHSDAAAATAPVPAQRRPVKHHQTQNPLQGKDQTLTRGAAPFAAAAASGSGCAAATAVGPRPPQPSQAVQFGVSREQGRVGGFRPVLRSHGTQTWAPAPAPMARQPPEAKWEAEQNQAAGLLGPLPTVSSEAPHAHATAGAYGSGCEDDMRSGAAGLQGVSMKMEGDVARLGHSNGCDGLGGGGGGGVRRQLAAYPAVHGCAAAGRQTGGDMDGHGDEERYGEGAALSLPYTQRSGGAPGARYNRQVLREQLLRPPPLERSHPDVDLPMQQATHRNGAPNAHKEYHIRHQPELQQWQYGHHQKQPYQRSFPSPPRGASAAAATGRFFVDENDALLQQPQLCAACQTTPSSRDASAMAVVDAARRRGWCAPAEADPLDADLPSHQLPQQQEGQRQKGPVQEHLRAQLSLEQQARGAQLSLEQQARGTQPSLEQQARGIQPSLERQARGTQQDRRQQEPPPPPFSQQSPQPLQPRQRPSQAPGPSMLLSGSVPLARRSAADEQPAPSSAGAGAAAVAGRATAATGAAGCPVGAAGGRYLGAAQSAAVGGPVASAAGGAGPSGTAAAAPVFAAAGTGIAQDLLWRALRREYEKRLRTTTLKKKLQKHLSDKGNSMIKQYCRKVGLPWTLLEVAAYGVALQKLAADRPFEVKSAVHFLARVKGWSSADGGGAAAPHGPDEPPPASLIEKAATVMASATAKYDLPAFIQRQRRNKKPAQPQPALPQQQQSQSVLPQQWQATAVAKGLTEPAGVDHAAAAAARTAAATLPCNAATTPSTAETASIGVTAPAVTTTTAGLQPQRGIGGSSAGGDARPGGGDSDRDGDGDGGDRAAAQPLAGAEAAAAPAEGRAAGARRGRGAAVPPLGGSRGLETRLREYLAIQGLSTLRPRNLRMGLRWTLLDLVEKDMDVRLQKGGDSMDAAEVVQRLLVAKLGPGRELAPLEIQAVSTSVRAAYDKFRLGAFVAAEVKKTLKRKAGAGRKQKGAAAAPGGDGGGRGVAASR